jgi:hypothetical protein
MNHQRGGASLRDVRVLPNAGEQQYADAHSLVNAQQHSFIISTIMRSPCCGISKEHSHDHGRARAAHT